MDKEVLEKVLIKAVEYYFKGLSAKEAINKALEEVKERWIYMEITYVYKDRWNGEIKEKKFDSFDSYGRWMADNATEVINIDCIIEED